MLKSSARREKQASDNTRLMCCALNSNFHTLSFHAGWRQNKFTRKFGTTRPTKLPLSKRCMRIPSKTPRNEHPYHNGATTLTRDLPKHCDCAAKPKATTHAQGKRKQNCTSHKNHKLCSPNARHTWRPDAGPFRRLAQKQASAKN